MADIATLGMSIDTSDIRRATEELNRMTQAGSKAEQTAGGMASGFNKAAVGVAAIGTAATAATVAIIEMANRASEAGAAIERYATISNTSIQQFQQYAVGAKAAGTSMEKFADQLKDVNDKIGDYLQTGGGELADFFDGIAPQLDITADKFKKLGGIDGLLAFSQGLEKAGISSNQMIFFLEGIGNDLSSLRPLLANGAAGFKAFAEQADSLGIVLEDSVVKAFSDYQAQVSLTDQAQTAWQQRISSTLLPALSELDMLTRDLTQSEGLATAATEIMGGAVKGLTIVALGAAQGFSNLITRIAGYAAAAQQAANGDFKTAGETISQVHADIEASSAKYEARIKSVWEGTATTAVKAAADLNNQLREGNKQTGTAIGLTANQNSELKKLTEKRQDEINKLKELSEVELARIELQRLKIPLDSAQAKAYLATAKAQDDANKKSEAEKKAKTEAASATKKLADEQQKLTEQISDFIAESTKQTQSLDLLANAYLKGGDAIRQAMVQAEIEAEVLKLGESARGRVIAQINALNDARDRAKVAEQVDALRNEVAEQLQLNAATIQGTDAVREYNIQKDLAAALAGKNISAVSAEAAEMETYIRTLYRAKDANQQLANADSVIDRLYPEQVALRKYNEEVAALNAAMEQYPDRADAYQMALAKLGDEYRKNSKETDAWSKLTDGALDRIDEGFASLWKSAFTGFKDFGSSIKDAFLNLLAELAHAAITKPIILQLGAALGIGGTRSALGGTSGVGGLGSSVSQSALAAAYNSYTSGTSSTGMTGALGQLGSTISGLDQSLGQMYGELFYGSSSTYAPFSYQMANSGISWTGIAGGAFAGYQAGGVGGAALGAGGAYAGGLAGSALGSYVGGTLGTALGPVGTVIGAAIGSAIAGSLGFGKSGERFKETYTSASGYSTGGIYTGTGTPSQLAGKRMFGDDYDNYLNSVNEKFTSTLSGLLQEFGSQVDYIQADIYARLRRTSGKIAADLTTNLPGMTEGDWTSLQWARSYGGDAKDIPGQLEKFANDVLGEWLAESITKMEALPEYFRAQFEELASNAETTAEDVQNKITSIFNSFNAVNEALDLVGISMLELTNEGMKASDAIAAAAGGYEALATAVNGFYDQFYSDQEKANRILEKVPESFADLEMTLPATRAAYRAMVGDIDVTTEAGQQMFANMMSMAASADSYYDILEAKAANLLAMEQNFYTKFAPESVQTGNMIGGMITAMSELGLSIPNTREEFYALVQTMDKSTESGRATYEGLLALTDGMDNYYNTVAALQAEAINRQSADRRAEIDERRAVQEAEAALQQQRRDDYAAADQAYDEQRAAMLAAGDAVGYLTATVARITGNPEYAGGTSNYEIAALTAQAAREMTSALSENALRVENVGQALAQLSLPGGGGWNDPLTSGIAVGFVEQIRTAAGDAGRIIADAVQGAALVAAQQTAASMFTSNASGLADIMSTLAAADFMSASGTVAGIGTLYGRDVVAYGEAVGGLNHQLEIGTITADQYNAALSELNAIMPSTVANFEQQVAAMETVAQRQGEISSAIDGMIADSAMRSLNYYFGQLNDMADQLEEAADAASEPISQVAGVIGRLGSMSTAFGTSATLADLTIPEAEQSLSVAMAQLIADAAAQAAEVMTTQQAAEIATQLEGNDAFAELTASGIRDAALLLEGIGQYDAPGFEAAFIRISDALADGSITAEQFSALFDVAIATFEGTADAADDVISYLDRVNAVLSDMSKALLPLDAIGEAAAARMVELAGGIEAFEQGYSTWFSQFLSDAEQQNKVMADVIEAFAKANVPLADTRDAFSGMVNAIDTSTESGQNMLATLLSLMDEADSYYNIVEAREEEKRRAEEEYAAKQAEQLAIYQQLRGALSASGLAMEGMTLITPELIAGFNDLAEQLGGVDAAAGALSSYYQNFFTEAERTAIAVDQAAMAFEAAGVAIPASRDGFREMMEALDLTTEAGRSMFGTLLGLAESADTYFDYLDSLNQQVTPPVVDTDTINANLEIYGRFREAIIAAGLAINGMTLVTTGLAADFAKIAEGLGGIDAATNALSAYYQNFFTEAERTEAAMTAVENAFSAANIALPAARDGFRALMEGIDLTTESGRSMFATLLGLADDAAAYFDEIERRESARQAAISEFYQAFTPVSVQQSATLAAFREEMDKLGVTLPASRWQFGELVNKIDQTTDAGKALYGALLGARNAANEYYQILEQIAMSNVEKAFASLQRAVAAETDKINSSLAQRTTEINAYYDEQETTQTAAYDLMLEQTQARYDAERAAAEAAYDAELAALEQQYQEQSDMADAAYQAQKDALALMLDTAQEALSSLKTIFSALEDGFNTVVDASEVMTQMARAQAEQVVSQALTMARGGQSLAGMTTLPDAVAAVSDIAANQYSTSVEFLREQGRTANELFELKGYAGDQVTVQEALVASIEAQSDLLSDEFDASRDLAKSIYADQERALRDRFNADRDAAEAALKSTLQAMEDAKELTIAQLELARQSAISAAENAARLQIDAINAQMTAAEHQYNALRGIDDSVVSVETAVQAMQEALSNALAVSATQIAGAVSSAVSAAQASAVAAVQASEAAAQAQADLAAYQNTSQATPIPAFAAGGMASGLYMAGEAGPELIVSGPARVHNANDTAKILAGGSNSEETAALRQDVADLRQLLKLIAVNTKVAADGIRQQNDSGLPVIVVETV